MRSVSVIVPAHNDEATIRSALISVEESVDHLHRQPGLQDVAAEVVVVDDGSRDGTLATILDVARSKELFRVFHRPSGTSPGAARNCGATLATGDVLLFLDADDLFLTNHVFECYHALEDESIHWVKTAVSLPDSVHPAWRNRIENSLVINLAIRRRCHEFIGGFLDVHLFRRSGDAFEPWIDIFRLIEDVHYNALLDRLFKRGDVGAETVRYMRRPGNSFDRQFAKFLVPPGSYREVAEPEFEFRVRLSKVIVEYQRSYLERKKAETDRLTQRS